MVGWTIRFCAFGPFSVLFFFCRRGSTHVRLMLKPDLQSVCILVCRFGFVELFLCRMIWRIWRKCHIHPYKIETRGSSPRKIMRALASMIFPGEDPSVFYLVWWVWCFLFLLFGGHTQLQRIGNDNYLQTFISSMAKCAYFIGKHGYPCLPIF